MALELASDVALEIIQPTEIEVVEDTTEPFSVVRFYSLDELPDTSVPYYVVSRDGFYLRKQTSIGPCLLLQKSLPTDFESLGEFKNGYFQYSAPLIPHEIIAQTVSFFRKVWEDRKAEAEVIILLNDETREFQIFVPYQVVSSGSVDSIYDSSELPEGFYPFGTIHSHCNFSAFHSGIDEGDARNFNGVHITIGHVDQENPSFASMVMINKIEFSFKTASSLAEIEGDLDELEAPDSWLTDYVFEDAIPILAKDFPGIPQADLNIFAQRTRQVTTWVKDDKKKKDDKDDQFVPYWMEADTGDDNETLAWWKKFNRKDDKKSDYVSTRYSFDFRTQLPDDFFEPSYAQNKIKAEHFEEVLTKQMEQYFDLASKYGLYLEYKLLNMTDDDLFE